MQPLDVSVFGPVKAAYKRAYDNWMKRNAGIPMQIMHIPMLVRKALNKGALKENIESGFKATGICPFDDAIFNDSNFITSKMSNKNKKLIIFESQFDEEEQRRIVLVNGDDDFDLAGNETVSTTDESMPGPSHPSHPSSAASHASHPSSAASHTFNEARAASEARVGGYVALLEDIGPVQNAP